MGMESNKEEIIGQHLWAGLKGKTHGTVLVFMWHLISTYFRDKQKLNDRKSLVSLGNSINSQRTQNKSSVLRGICKDVLRNQH